MNLTTATSLSGYIDTLYSMNQKFIKLCGIDTNDLLSPHTILLEILQDIPRVIPYSYDNKTKGLILNPKNGLLELSFQIPYLVEKYTHILSVNYILLDRIRLVRNKYEHKMHDITVISCISCPHDIFTYSFEVGKNYITISSSELITLFKELNILFYTIVNDVISFAQINDLTQYPYYYKLNRFDFNHFNKIYDSGLLREIGTCCFYNKLI